MYRLLVTVVQVMDLYDVTAVLLADYDNGEGWQPIARRSDTLSDPLDGSGDPFHSILGALRLWSDMTIRA
jgi:hypothetical protein